MIGGTDTVIPTPLGAAETLEAAAITVRARWPQAVFIVNGGRYRTLRQVPFGAAREMFIHRDADSVNSWDAQGCDPTNAETMVYLLWEPGELTIVHNNLPELADSIRQFLRTGRPR